MTLGGTPAPIYVVTDAEIASGEFSIAPGVAMPVSALDLATRGVSGGNALPVYVVEQAEANRRGLSGGIIGAMPVVDTTAVRPVHGAQVAIPVYVTQGSLGAAPAPEVPPPDPGPAISQITPTNMVLDLGEFWTFDRSYSGELHADSINWNLNDLGWPDIDPTGGIWGGAIHIYNHDSIRTLNNGSPLVFGDRSWAMGAVMRFDSFSGAVSPINSAAHGGGAQEWLLLMAGTDVYFWIYNGTTSAVVTIQITTPIVIDTWYSFVWGYDSVANEGFLHVDGNSARVGQTGAPGVGAGSSLILGTGEHVNGAFKEIDGRIDSMWYTKDYIPTAPQIALAQNAPTYDGVSYFGYKRVFYGFDDTNLVPVGTWRERNTSTDLGATFPESWSDIPAMRDDMTWTLGNFYPSSPIGGWCGMAFLSPGRVLDNDQWCEMTVVQSTGWDADDWMGPAVRMSTAVESNYSLVVEATNWKLMRLLTSAETVLATDTHVTAVGDKWRIEAEGTTIRAYKNDVEIASVTDVTIAGGLVGIVSSGLDADMKFSNFRYGDLPVGNCLIADRGWVSNVAAAIDGITITDDCGIGADERLFNHLLTETAMTHNVNHQHYIDVDFGEFRIVSGMRLWSDSASLTYQYDNITFFAKLDVGDSWSTMTIADASGGVGANFIPVDGLHWIPFACRYIRMEIDSTEDANNFIAAMEWELTG